MLTEPSYAPQDRTPEIALTSQAVAKAIITLRVELLAEYGTDFAFQVHGRGGVIGASTKGYGHVGPFWNPATEVDPDDDERELYLISDRGSYREDFHSDG